MGLAPYGKPVYTDVIKDKLIHIKDDGSFHLDMSYFDYCTDLKMTNKKFNKLFGGLPRRPESKLSQREMDIAASIQKVTEEIVVKLATHIAHETKQQNLCLAGGVALNCVANGVLLREHIFDRIWIQPAAGDAGGALGAALAIHHIMLGNARPINDDKDSMHGAYLGPSFTTESAKTQIANFNTTFKEYSDDKLIENTARALADGKTIGWMQGRMEFGPRALGGRSIIVDPRSPKMQKLLNLKIKYRESFRPFAPSVLLEHVNEWFDLDIESPYMLLVANIAAHKKRPMTDAQRALFGIDKLNIPRSEIPSVTHVDYSARVQTVDKNTNPRYHRLISKFYEITGCPLLVNTSFNIRGEPIVCTPTDAFKCFMGTELDLLVIANIMLNKDEQDKKLITNYNQNYDLD